MIRMIQSDSEIVSNEVSYCITNIQDTLSNTIKVMDAALDDFWSKVSELEGTSQISDDLTKQSCSTCSILYKHEYMFGYYDRETSLNILMDSPIDSAWSSLAQFDDTPKPYDVLNKTSHHTCLAFYNNEYMNIHAQYGRNLGGMLIQAMLQTRL